MEPVRLEFDLSDTQLGFLSGIAFALFYATLGIPIAHLADRTSRTGVISVCLALWSGMTALCGVAQNFWQLMLARIGVAVGEAGGSPPSHSLIADYFRDNERATALGIFALGVPIGTMFGLFIGGWVNEWLGWRLTFMVVGLPGVLLALVVWFSVREPRRNDAVPASSGATRPTAAPTVREALRYFWSQRSLRFLALASAVHAFAFLGLAQWYPVFFIRSHGLSTGEIGTYMALVVGLFGGIGAFAGGFLADRLADRDRRWYLWLPMFATGLAAPFFFGVFLVTEHWLAFTFMVVPALLLSVNLGPIFSMTQGLVPPAMRATAAAVLLFVINIIGMGLGPQFAGVLSDLLQPAYGVESLRYALLVLSMFTLLSAAIYGLAARWLRDDLTRVGEKPPERHPLAYDEHQAAQASGVQRDLGS
jgi:predicted MFS family arabinose efflux permease